jgi:hypothetical protein
MLLTVADERYRDAAVDVENRTSGLVLIFRESICIERCKLPDETSSMTAAEDYHVLESGE